MERNFETDKYEQLIEQILKQALEEDIGEGDITTEAIVDDNITAEAAFLLKEDGIFAGELILRKIFKEYAKDCILNIIAKEGSEYKAGTILARAQGSAKSLLKIERTALNLLQRMSGIATLTNIFVKKISHTKAKILDTRKTCPGLRILDKMAVAIGGGKNHRMGLYDMILIKDNHIEAAGGIRKAIAKAKEYLNTTGRSDIKIEVEAANLDMVKEALDEGCDIIMLDNFAVDDMKRAVAIVNGRIPLEASGKINLNNVIEAAETGVDYISIGALTHSVKALDISMKIKLIK